MSLNVNEFIVNKFDKTLIVKFDNQGVIEFDMEYLRVVPAFAFQQLDQQQSAQSQKTNIKPVSNKKCVLLSIIESLGKHGFRLLFDDGHSVIITIDEFFYLQQNQQSLWQQYLTELNKSGLSREATIDIVEVK